jgi:Na+-translocating ferredoxin:NAD+ oxidoreductase RnfG subunit
VKGWRVLESADTAEHVDLVKKETKFSEAFTDWNPQQVLPKVHAVSGATLTSAAITQSIQQRLRKESASILFPDEVELSEAQSLFPQAAALEQKSTGLEVYNKQHQLLGLLVRTASDSATGYAGPTEVLIALLPDGKTIHGVTLRSIYDTENYVYDVRQAQDYLAFFQGRTVAEVANMNWDVAGVEGVSGATQTSYAVAAGIKQRLARLAAERQAPSWALNDWLLIVIVLLAHVLAFTSLRGKWWLRWLWQSLVIGYVGLTTGTLISLGLLAGWVQHGVGWQLTPSLVLLVAAALMVPWASRRQLYCHHICPHGALQQWLSKWSKWRVALPPWLHRWLSYLPWILLTLAFVSLLLGWAWELNAWEPFDAWSWRAGALAPLVIAVIGLLCSMFIPQAYCHYGCPTGAVFKLVRSTGTLDHWSARDWGLLLALVFSLISVSMTNTSQAQALSVCKGQSMGTSWELKLRGQVPAGLKQKIQAELDHVEALLSTWRKDSIISQFNAYQDSQPHALPQELLNLIIQANAISETSAGALDITVGALVKAWNFGPPPRSKKAPSEAEIQRLLKTTGWKKLVCAVGTLCKLQPEIQIDLCALAEGWALDRIAGQLDAYGIDYLMELGGNCELEGAGT